MGCAKSKNKKRDAYRYTRGDQEGRPGGRYDGANRSNESLIITVLWRRLSLFSRRGSTRKQSLSGKSPDLRFATDSPGTEIREADDPLPDGPNPLR